MLVTVKCVEVDTKLHMFHDQKSANTIAHMCMHYHGYILIAVLKFAAVFVINKLCPNAWYMLICAF